MRYSLQLLETEQSINAKIMQALLPDIKRYMAKVSRTIKAEFPYLIENILSESPTLNDLTRGRLRLELGIPDPINKILGILDIWKNNVAVTYIPPKATFNGGIESNLSIGIIQSDYSDILGSDYAYVYDNVGNYKLPWLQWLLLDGTKPIVDNHRVLFTNKSSRSRTGGAIMVGSTRSWSVPPQHAGTMEDNWITREIDKNQDVIEQFLKDILKS